MNIYVLPLKEIQVIRFYGKQPYVSAVSQRFVSRNIIIFSSHARLNTNLFIVVNLRK